MREALGFGHRRKTAFARLLGIKGPSLHDLENDTSKAPSSRVLLKIRDAGGNPDYVMYGKGKKLLPNAPGGPLEEDSFIDMFRELTPLNRKHVTEIMKTLRRSQGGPAIENGHDADE